MFAIDVEAEEDQKPAAKGKNNLPYFVMAIFLSLQEVQKMEVLLVEFLIDCGLPFCIVKHASFKRFIGAIQMFASGRLPGRTKLKDTLLHDLAEKAVVFLTTTFLLNSK